MFGRRRTLLGFFIVVVALMAVVGLLEGGRIVAGFSLATVVLIAEVVLAVVHRTKPERQPTLELLEGIVSIEEDEDGEEVEAPNARWFVGEQRVHLPPHWQEHLVGGAHARVRVARPPGERLAYVLGIDGRSSADFERSQGLPPAPAEQPILLLMLFTSGLVAIPGLLIGAAQLAFGEGNVVDGLSTLSAMAASEQVGTVAEVERQGLPERGMVTLQDATVLPRELIVDPPADAAWAVLSSDGRDRLIVALEAKHGRKVGSIPNLEESSTPVSLSRGDVLAWRRAELNETRGPTGRPGDQVFVWVGRKKPLDIVRTSRDTEDPPLLRAREQAENLALATGGSLLGLLALPVFLLTFTADSRGRAQRAQFRERVLRAYASGLAPPSSS